MSANTQPRFDRAQTPEQSAVIARLQHGFAAHLQSEPLSVTRWLMYGQARLYVKTQTGRPIGWVDVRTGERVIEVPEMQPAFEAAIAAAQPGIPAAYTPRRAQLQSVTAGRGTKTETPAPRRLVPDPDQPVWSVVTETGKPDTQRRGRRSAATPSTAASPQTSTELAVPEQEKFRFGRLDALADRLRLRHGATEQQVLAQTLGAFIGRQPGWDYLAAADLGIADAAVDFVVGGPAGIFAIDVITPTMSAFRGTGFAKRASIVLTSAMEAPVWVRHVLVPIGFSTAEVALLPTELPMVSRRQLRGFLLRQPHVLSAGDVELALGYARLHWTWRS